jgi:hypothetical protein
MQFRFAEDPRASVDLVAPEKEGRFIQIGDSREDWSTFRRLPAGLAVAQIVIAIFVLLSMVSVIVYAPFWFLGGIRKKLRRPPERSLRIWPLVSVLSLVVAYLVINHPMSAFSLSNTAGLAKPTFWSIGLCGLTVLFALAALWSAFVVCRARKLEVRRWVWIHSAIVTLALLIAAFYLAFWGMIGFRSWIQL